MPSPGLVRAAQERVGGPRTDEAEMQHREIPIKVTAWVDEGVAPLVEALNEFPHLTTLDSCEDRHEHGAYVLFRCEGEDPAGFVAGLGGALSAEPVDFVLRAEWRRDYADPLLELSCPPKQVDDLAAAVSACRRRLSPGDSSRTAPRSSRGRRSLHATAP